MESRMVKFYSKESNIVAIHAIPGHFATSHSHVNYYVDITSLKTRVREAREIASILSHKMGGVSLVDTIVCMDGTEVIGAFLAEAFENGNYASTNAHETIYVVQPEMNSSNQLLFRDNTKAMIEGKHVVLLLASTTTGKTVQRSLEGIQYYGGTVEGVASVFSVVPSLGGYPVHAVFTEEDVPGYAAYSAHDCPFCKQGIRLEAVVNGYGYSKL